MKNLKRIGKTRTRAGESLVEILIAILIVALGCVVIATMYSAAMNMNVEASRQDDEFYEAMSEMEIFGGSETSHEYVIFKDKNGTGSHEEGQCWKAISPTRNP